MEQDQLDSFLKSATALKIQGLTHNSEDNKESETRDSKQVRCIDSNSFFKNDNDATYVLCACI